MAEDELPIPGNRRMHSTTFGQWARKATTF
jgi:hypothetical protein